MRNKTSWKPVRRGEIYCSPECGRGCTITEFNHATEQAKRLCSRLYPKGKWKPDVWENMGWHFVAVLETEKSYLSVSESDDGSYHCMMDSSGPGCASVWYDPKHFKDPNKAVTHRLKLAEAYLCKITDIVNAARASMKG